MYTAFLGMYFRMAYLGFLVEGAPAVNTKGVALSPMAGEVWTTVVPRRGGA